LRELETAGISSMDDYTEFLRSIGISNPTDLGDSPTNQEILDLIGYEDPETVRVTAPKGGPDLGTVEVVGKREPDLGTVEVVGKREPDLGEVVVTAPKDVWDEPVVPDIIPTEAPTAPPLPPVTPPPTPTAAPTAAPPKVTPKQIAKMLGVPVTSPIVQDVIEALYGTMEYLDVGKEFSPSERKAKPAATQKQQQQTKMAQGGYLDDLLAEATTADDLLKLLR
jgi:hypothetical protein